MARESRYKAPRPENESEFSARRAFHRIESASSLTGGGNMSRSNSVKCTLTATLVLLILNATTLGCLAADYNKIGVKSGDIAEYHVASQAVVRWNRIVVVFSNVTPPLVTIDVTNYMDGTKIVGGSSIENVSRQVTDLYLISAGLAQGDPIYDGADRTINETILMTVLGQSRYVNHLNLYEGRLNLYWDRETGLLVNASKGLLLKTTHPTTFVWFNTTIVSTTAFGADATLVIFEGGVLMVLLAAVAIVVYGRRVHRK
jgi:hypothetical protein